MPFLSPQALAYQEMKVHIQCYPPQYFKSQAKAEESDFPFSQNLLQQVLCYKLPLSDTQEKHDLNPPSHNLAKF